MTQYNANCHYKSQIQFLMPIFHGVYSHELYPISYITMTKFVNFLIFGWFNLWICWSHPKNLGLSSTSVAAQHGIDQPRCYLEWAARSLGAMVASIHGELI